MKTFKEQKWMIIVYGVILFAIGLVDLILSIVDLGSAIKVVSYCIAGGLFVIGLLHIVANLIKDTKSFFKGALALGCIAIALGVVFIVYPLMLGDFFIIFSAAFVIAISAVFLVKGFIGIKFKYKKSWIFLYFLLATIGITLSILAFVYEGSSTVTQIVYITMGAIGVAVGVTAMVYGIKLLNKKDE